MSYKTEHADTPFVSRIKNLTALVDANDAGKTSLMSHARHFFALTPALKEHINLLDSKIEKVKKTLNHKLLQELTDEYQSNVSLYEKECRERSQHINRIIRTILELCEGETYYETQNASARCLGTLLLLTGENNTGYARLHQRLRPLYKAILALRLVDKILADGSLKHPYLSKHKGLLERFDSEEKMDEWTRYIATPVLTAALLQDIGLNHDSAQQILFGKDRSMDPFREVSDEERKQLLKINYQQTLTFIREGLESTDDDAIETHHFAVELIQDIFVGKSGIGDLLKIPQIYSSIVLSTKPGYAKNTLPKSYLLIERLAKQQSINARLAAHFISVVGYFPVGFGICFIPLNDKGEEKNNFEYAIVSGLNPELPADPVCKVVSRNQTFCVPVKELRIPVERNLYFNSSKQKLMKINRERLAEIMSQLRSNFSMDDVDNHIPSYWEPHDFFADKKNQGIWR